jgi:hypothetical protein
MSAVTCPLALILGYCKHDSRDGCIRKTDILCSIEVKGIEDQRHERATLLRPRH